MILAGWKGFTKFDVSSVSEDWVNNSVTYLSVEELPGGTQWDLMLKKQILLVFLTWLKMDLEDWLFILNKQLKNWEKS